MVGLVASLLGLPFLLALLRAAGDQLRRSMEAARTGAPTPGVFSFYDDSLGPLIGSPAVSLAVTALYHALFLRWRAATPGKLAVGLRVRSRDDPGPLPWSTIGRRLVGQYWYLVLLVVPVVGSLAGLWAFVDNAFVLAGPERRALHDRLADTVVVDARWSV